jgi:hypothetical protein
MTDGTTNVPRRHKGNFAKVEPSYWLNSGRIRKLPASLRARYMDLWCLARSECREDLSPETSRPEHLRHLWRCSAKRAREALQKLTEGDDALIRMTHDNRVVVVGCSKVHGKDRSGTWVVRPAEHGAHGEYAPYRES